MVLLLLRTTRSNTLADYDVIIISIDTSFFPTSLRCNIGVIEVFIPVTTRVVCICMNELLATLERTPTTCAGKPTITQINVKYKRITFQNIFLMYAH